jgi:hypothetical protein
MVASAMLKQLSTYQWALYLVTGIVLIEVIVLLVLASYDFELAKKGAPRLPLPLFALFGIWTQSYFFRYLGAALLAIVGVLTLAMLFERDTAVGVLWAVMLIGAALSLLTSFILVFSRTFSAEFARERKLQPRYKYWLRSIAVAVIVVVGGVGALRDIWKLIALINERT